MGSGATISGRGGVSRQGKLRSPPWLGRKSVFAARCLSRNGEVKDQSVDASSPCFEASSSSSWAVRALRLAVYRPQGCWVSVDELAGGHRPRFVVSQHFRSVAFSPACPSGIFFLLPLLRLILFSVSLALSLSLFLSPVPFPSFRLLFPQEEKNTKYHEIGRGALYGMISERGLIVRRGSQRVCVRVGRGARGAVPAWPWAGRCVPCRYREWVLSLVGRPPVGRTVGGG